MTETKRLSLLLDFTPRQEEMIQRSHRAFLKEFEPIFIVTEDESFTVYKSRTGYQVGNLPIKVCYNIHNLIGWLEGSVMGLNNLQIKLEI